jgi:hypothetical protein
MATGKDVKGSDHGLFQDTIGHLLEGLRETTKTLVRIAGALAQIRNGHLPHRNVTGGVNFPDLCFTLRIASSLMHYTLAPSFN